MIEFKYAIDVVSNTLIKIYQKIDPNDYDGLIVKNLKSSNTLDKDRKSNQTHIAITGEQMELFPYIKSDSYFSSTGNLQNNPLKKYFVGQIPITLYKSNMLYLDENANIFNDNQQCVYVSIVRSRRSNSSDQIQMSIIDLDSPKFIEYRHLIHVNDYLVILKRKEQLLYDMFVVKADDVDKPFSELNNQLAIDITSTKVSIDKLITNCTSETQDIISYDTGFESDFERNRIVFGAPGTGKSFELNKDRIKLLGAYSDVNYERVTFHPDYSYANFVGTYKPIVRSNVFSSDSKSGEIHKGQDEITYEYVPGPFLRVLVKALKSAMSDNPKPFLLIIEEINRANVASVFGDIFQLLDRNENNYSQYPINVSEDMKNYLSKEFDLADCKFENIRIPDNMFIWATMNSADQGVFPMDTAFKRRWNFTYIGINDNDSDLKNKTVVLGSTNVHKVEWNALRKSINDFLAKLQINEDKQLGPYFIDRKIVVPKNGNEIDSEQFINVFKNKVIMYLYEDAARQKRNMVFANCGETNNRYSEICKEFDKRGIEIFHNDIQSLILEYVSDFDDMKVND